MNGSSVRPTDTVGVLVRRRLQEIGRAPEELAEHVAVPAQYIADLIAGERRPPLPGRTDIYGKMNAFLGLRRNDVENCAKVERAGTPPLAAAEPAPRVCEMLLALCVPATARALEQRRAGSDGVELAGLAQRVLDVTQGAVRRELDDPIGLRLAAAERGSTFVQTRFKILEFLDATADTLTAADLIAFVHPRIAQWDVNLETGVLRVVLRPPGPRGRPARRPLQE